MDVHHIEPAPQSPRDETSKERPRDASGPRVRRRNRMITSCLECRRRKLRCDKQNPCLNCIKFVRDCMFLAPALDSVSQKKLNEIKEKMGSLERTLEDDVARRKSEDQRKNGRRESADLPGEGNESDEGPVPEDEKGLEATPLATVDAAYEDDGNDDALDLGFRVGKFRMTERLGGLFRPKLAEEMVFALVRDNKRGTEPEAPLTDDANAFLDPGPAFIAPGSSFVFGDTGTNKSIIDFLPTKQASDLLVKRYRLNCHFLARVVHWPTFQMQYESFWTQILSGIEPPASLQALVFAVSFQAIASMSNSEVDSVFQQSHRQVLVNFQQATEVALAKAHFLRTTRFETLQALIIYLIPMCRGELSRAHSVLVGAAIRLGECFSLHRDPVETFGHSPIDAHVRRLAWFQLCYLDFRTAESQGPRPSIKREDYDTKMPWNLDDNDLIIAMPAAGTEAIDLREKESQWTDVTLSKIRFECCEMHRIVWHDRVRLDKQKVTLTHCLSKIEAFRKAMEEKYQWLDITITIQHYARILLDQLLLRMHIMILHKFHNATTTRIPDRLRQIVIASGTTISEAAVKLDIDPKFDNYKWYNSAIAQWHTAFLLLVEVFVYPNRREADRIWSICDHVFEPDLTLTRVQKARSILGAVRDRAAAYRNVRKMAEPMSMRGRLNTSLPARARIRGPDMVVPSGQPVDPNVPGETQAIYSLDRRRSSTGQGYWQQPGQIPTTTVQAPTPDQQGMLYASPSDNNQASASWSVDSPYTFFMKDDKSLTKGYANRTNLTTSPPYIAGAQHANEPSPSNSSQYTEQWPPSISRTQQATYNFSQSADMPFVNAMSPPSDQSTPPPPLYGNSAMGLMSGQYIPPTNNSSYSNTPSMVGPVSPDPSGGSVPSTTFQQMANTRAPASGPAQTTPSVKDLPMLDVDWAEWDRLFPLEENSGELDLPYDAQRMQ